MMIRYDDSLEDISADDLTGFFAGWPDPPSPEAHLRLLRGSGRVVLAIDDSTGHVVGFITAITDGVLSAYIPLLEVLPQYQGRGIGTELVRRMLGVLDLYMVDVVCDPDVVPFYERFGMIPGTAMMSRRNDRQSGHERGLVSQPTPLTPMTFT